MAATLAVDTSLDLLALWADRDYVHAIFRDALSGTGAVLPASVAVAGGLYPALSPVRPAAAWFERMIRELWGHVAEAGRELRSGAIPSRASAQGARTPARLSFNVEGDTVSRLELRPGFAGPVLAGLRGQSPETGAGVISGLSADCPVAHGIAYARAVEAAAQVVPPTRAIILRAILAELERLANHLADLALVSDITRLALLPTRFAFHREAMAEIAARAFGPSLRGRVVPGGTAGGIDAGEIEPMMRAIEALELELPRLALLYKRAAGHKRLIGLGAVRPQVAARFAVGGVVGRASGRVFDARRSPGYPPYAGLDLNVPVRNEGDVDARVRVRMDEALESCRWLRGLIAAIPAGPLAVALPPASGEGIGVAEGPRGDVWHWVRLDGGTIADAFPRDTSWLQWPVLEAIAVGSLVADFPLIEKSFNCSYEGMDL
jgi:Ni,Fe-hydrogenase III large subunit